MARMKVVVAGLLLAAAAVGGWVATTSDVRANAVVGSAAPAFSLVDQEGRSVTLADLKGKVVVLEWFNPECPFVVRHCKSKTMVTLAQQFRGQGVQWIGINSSGHQGREVNQRYAAEWGIDYPLLDDSKGEVGRAYGARTTPHMFVIGKDGTLLYNGAIDDDPRGEKEGDVNFVAQALDAALKGTAVPAAETKPYGCSVKYRNS